jgi:prolyl 4-hydroxylase
MPCGVRILTLFIYLNDVEEGGGTSFPIPGIVVTPKKGSAVLWPSVRDDAPEQKDHRTDHEALPVLKGKKYGANAWIHSRDFKAAFNMNCH